MSNNLRDEMPQTAAFIDSLRLTFGRLDIDQQIRKGLKGEPTFWAEENGRTIGTKPADGSVISSAHMVFEGVKRASR